VRALAKQLNDNRSLLADVDMRIERLAGAEARFAAGVESNFRVLSDRVERVSERVTAALEARRRVIAQALQRGLEQEMARTRQYLITARIAIARATDQLAAAPPGTPGGDS
jgi:L-serine deaminase